MNLKFNVAYCTQTAAEYAVTHWHYSKTMPPATCRLGVWEDGRFIGAVIFGNGANRNAGEKLGTNSGQIRELVRVALCPDHQTATSAIVAAAVRFFKKENPNIQALISYADTGQGHVGTIYQAMNWIYVGYSRPQTAVLFKGKKIHKKRASRIAGTAQRKTLALYGMKVIQDYRKHTYFYLFDRTLINKLTSLPYPKKIIT